MIIITSLTASLLSLLFVAMALKVVKLRHHHKVALGASGHDDLEKTIRAHGNFAEYTPIALLLLLCAELNKANWIILSVLAFLFILGRLFHAYAFIINKHHFRFRVRGMTLTFLAILGLAALNCVLLIQPLL